MKVLGRQITRENLLAYNRVFDFDTTLSVLNYKTNGVVQGSFVLIGKFPASFFAFSYEVVRNSIRILKNSNVYRKNRSIERRNDSSVTGNVSRIYNRTKAFIVYNKKIILAAATALAIIAAYFKGPQALNFLKNFEYKANLRNSYHAVTGFATSSIDKAYNLTNKGLSWANGLVS